MLRFFFSFCVALIFSSHAYSSGKINSISAVVSQDERYKWSAADFADAAFMDHLSDFDWALKKPNLQFKALLAAFINPLAFREAFEKNSMSAYLQLPSAWSWDQTLGGRGFVMRKALIRNGVRQFLFRGDSLLSRLLKSSCHVHIDRFVNLAEKISEDENELLKPADFRRAQRFITTLARRMLVVQYLGEDDFQNHNSRLFKRRLSELDASIKDQTNLWFRSIRGEEYLDSAQKIVLREIEVILCSINQKQKFLHFEKLKKLYVDLSGWEPVDSAHCLRWEAEAISPASGHRRRFYSFP